jgi:hypothetical protein
LTLDNDNQTNSMPTASTRRTKTTTAALDNNHDADDGNKKIAFIIIAME